MRTLPTVSRILTLLLCCLSVSNQADSATVFQDDADLLDVCAVDAQHVWAVGSRGTILHSADGGTTWEFQNANVDCRFESVHFVDAKTGWCAGGYSQPISHKGGGVLLATTDGGLTWNRIGDDFLPWLKRIHFLNEQQGFAIGHSTSVYASGIFRTSDGGANWTPVIARTSSAPQDTSFLSDGSGWILNDDGQLYSLQKGKLQAVFRFSDLSQKQWIESIAFHQHAAVAVGAHGTILHSADQGRTWQPATKDSNSNRQQDSQHVHWTDVQFVDEMAFAISGGAEIAISNDGGRSWQTSSTPYSLPLHAIAMADQQTGWAVGSFGGILKTSTGGKQWESQRIPQRQASILVVMPDVQHLPLSAFAKLATEEGLYTVVQPLAHPPEVDSTDRLNAPAAWRTAASLDGLAVSLQPPLDAVFNPHPSWAGSRETVAKYWQMQTGNDNILAQWAVDLAVRIRLLRPAAILTSQQFDNGLERQTQDLIAGAIELAGNESAVLPTDLPAWQPRLLMAIGDARDPSSVEISTNEFSLAAGQGLDSLVATARRMLDGNAFDAQADSYMQAMRLGGSLIQSGNLVSLFAASEHPKGGRNRRRATPLTPEIQAAQQQWQLARNVDAMIRQHQDDQTTLAKLGELTQGLDGHVRATLVFELAQAALRTGDLAAAKTYLSLFGGNFAHHPLAEAAVLQYFQISTSEEYDHAVRSPNAAPIQLVAATSPDQDPQEVRLSHNLELAKSIQAVQPTLMFDARFRFPLAALHRRSPLHQSEAEGFYRGELSSQVDFAWRSCAATELALLQPDAAMVKPMARCPAISAKPFLDGQLTDDAWQAAVPLELKVRAGRSDMPASYAFFVHDEEFLYFAFTAMKVPDFQYEQDDAVRQRDTDLRERDRMVLRLDSDRDYATCFCLTVDDRGWANDAVDEFAFWNPTWHIASTATERYWQIEAAIPLSELGANPIPKNTVWNMGIQRIVPRVGIAAWHSSKQVESRPTSFGLLTFGAN